jgi:hypothetical protein
MLSEWSKKEYREFGRSRNASVCRLRLEHAPIQLVLFHILGGTISARTLAIAFRFPRTTTITTGTECRSARRISIVVQQLIHLGDSKRKINDKDNDNNNTRLADTI